MARQKRKPTPPPSAKGKGGNEGIKLYTDIGNANKQKDANQTVWNSTQDNSLAAIDVYGEQLKATVNRLYKFTNTMNFDDIFSSLQGGFGMAKKVLSHLKTANAVRETLRKGNVIDALGQVSPLAKSALTSAGVSPEMFDKVLGVAAISTNVNGVIKSVINGDVKLLDGLNNALKAITGTDIGFIKDIQTVAAFTSAVINEFSALGIAIGEEWKNLTKTTDKRGNETFVTDVSTEVINTIGFHLAEYGDYKTLAAAINHASPKKIELTAGEIVKVMFEKFSLTSPHNKGKELEAIYKDFMAVLRSLRGNSYIWVPRGKHRQAINANLFLNASEDWKILIKSVMGNMFYLDADTGQNIQLDYSHDDNDVFLAFGLLNLGDGDFESELRKDFGDIVINDTQRVSPIVEPLLFSRE